MAIEKYDYKNNDNFDRGINTTCELSTV
jgi:hypothetical protein